MEFSKGTKREVYNKVFAYKPTAYREARLKLVSVHWCPSLAGVLSTASCLNVCILENAKDTFCF